ncbi:MAG: hypothetical protein JXQ65_16345 [Candidatus Marinimicrobia bacterium]|nr:hypothetical protein [Candidatus Neomarinimicrobiota bacterium]
MSTVLLDQAFTKAAKLPDEEQDSLAKWILAELASDQKWHYLLNQSEDELAEMAKEALEEYKKGKTSDLDLNQL